MDCWSNLKERIVDIIEYRVNTCRYGWYTDAYCQHLEKIRDFNFETPEQINILPHGIVAEVLFQEASEQLGFKCNPSIGDEDALGYDFELTMRDETRFIDVTVDTSQSGIRKKIKPWRFPTLFLPWNMNDGKSCFSYAQWYLSGGGFNGKEFLKSVVRCNLKVLDGLKRSVWEDKKVQREIYSRYVSDFSGSSVLYVNSLDGVLEMLKRGVGT